MKLKCAKLVYLCHLTFITFVSMALRLCYPARDSDARSCTMNLWAFTTKETENLWASLIFQQFSSRYPDPVDVLASKCFSHSPNMRKLGFQRGSKVNSGSKIAKLKYCHLNSLLSPEKLLKFLKSCSLPFASGGVFGPQKNRTLSEDEPKDHEE